MESKFLIEITRDFNSKSLKVYSYNFLPEISSIEEVVTEIDKQSGEQVNKSFKYKNIYSYMTNLVEMINNPNVTKIDMENINDFSIEIEKGSQQMLNLYMSICLN